MTRLALIFILLFDITAFAKDRPSCSEKELARQDCHLLLGIYDVRVLTKTVAWSDGTWHAVDDIPMKGEADSWEKISVETMGARPILQFWLWDKGVGETHIESLHWYVGTISKQKFSLLAEGLVRRRRLEPGPPVDENAKVAAKPRRPKFLYDNWENFSLKAMKNGDLEWRINGQKKILEKNPVKKQVQNGV